MSGVNNEDPYSIFKMEDMLVELVKRGIRGSYSDSTPIADLSAKLRAYDSRHGTAVPKPLALFTGLFAGSWTCPKCEKALTTETCRVCDIERSLVAKAHMEPFFARVESLFFEIIECQLQDFQSATSRNTKNDELKRKISQVLSSGDLENLQNRNWNVKGNIQRLLTMALELYSSVSVSSSASGPLCVDGNSENLFLALVRRLHEKQRQEYNVPKSELLASFENSDTNMRAWTCPLCSNDQPNLEADCGSCSVNSQTFRLIQGNRSSTGIKNFCRLCFIGFDLNLGYSSNTSRRDLHSQIKTFMSSYDQITHFEEAGFLIKRHLEPFFCLLLRGECLFPWQPVMYLEPNSVALFAYFIKALLNDLAAYPRYRGKIQVDHPKVVRGIDEEFDRNPSTRNKRSTAVDKFLYESSRMLSMICR